MLAPRNSNKDFFGGDDGVGVDGDGVIDVAGVASGVGDHDGNVAGAGHSEDELVALFEAIDAEIESAELVLAVGIGSRDVADEVGLELAESGAERVVEPGEIVVVADPVGQVDIDRRGRLPHGVIVLLVKGDGEDVPGMGSAHFGVERGGLSQGRRRDGRQGNACGAGSGEDCGGAVALVDIAINGHGGADLVIPLQAADGDGDIVDHAESFAVIGEGVMESSTDADADFVGEGAVSGKNGASGGKPEGFDQVAGVGNLHLKFFAWSEGAGAEFADVVGLVDEENVLVVGGLGLEEVAGVGDLGGDQAVVNATILFGWEDVGADREVVGVAVD
jgi:hypothetical protein